MHASSGEPLWQTTPIRAAFIVPKHVTSCDIITEDSAYIYSWVAGLCTSPLFKYIFIIYISNFVYISGV